MKYGIYDTKDNCWIGDITGPTQLDDYVIAKISAEVAEHRAYGTRAGRYKAMPYGDHTMKFKDEIETKMSSEQAIKEVEEGL